MSLNANSTEEEILDYLRTVHGIDPQGLDAAQLLAIAGAADGIDYTSQTPATARDVQAQAIANEGKTVINIPAGETREQQQDVFVSVNGVPFLIKRNVDVEVPNAVVEALKNAKQKRYRQEEDDKGRPSDMVEYEVLAYPFNTVSISAPAAASAATE